MISWTCPKCGSPIPAPPAGGSSAVCPSCATECLPPLPEQTLARLSPRPPAGGWGGRERFVVGLNVGVMSLLAVSITVVVNLLAAHSWTRWDWTHGGSFTLTGESLKFLEALPKEVTITFFPAVDPQNRLGALVVDRLRDVLQAYAMATPKIRLVEVSPIREPERVREIQARYGIEALMFGDLVFTCGHRKKVVGLTQCYRGTMNPTSTTGPPTYVFRGEEVVTNAINAVLVDHPIRARFVTGHGEASLTNHEPHGLSMFLAYLGSREFVGAEELLLHEAGRVPEDCDVLVFVGPEEPIPPAELRMISDYLDRGGRVCFCLEPGSDTGLEAIAATWGVALADDYVCDLARQAHLPDRPTTPAYFGVMDFGDHPAVERLHPRDTAPLFFNARSVEPAPRAPDGFAATRLLRTTDAPDGFAVRDRRAPPEFVSGRDRPGPIGLAVAVSPREETPGRSSTRLVVVGDAEFVQNIAVGLQGPNRTEFLVQTILWLGGTGAQIPVQRPAEQDRSFLVYKEQSDRIWLIVVLALPAFAAFMGLMVAWMRRT
ncbi:MAG: GldG family protein [Planctomycetes bacterium]|nr:GldG family protein [Planctomycetota bacterium]